MLELRASNKFFKDLKRILKRGKDKRKIERIINLLQMEETLPDSCREHLLSGNWEGYNECHIEGDWLLIYRIVEVDNILVLERTGTHSDLF